MYGFSNEKFDSKPGSGISTVGGSEQGSRISVPMMHTSANHGRETNKLPVDPQGRNYDRSPQPVQRELSDAYLESLSRTPRYPRSNTYDEMIEQIASEDPFSGDYKPSGIKLKKHTHHKTKKKHDITDKTETVISSDHTEESPSKRHKKKKKKSVSPSRETIVEKKVSPSFNFDKDTASVKSSGTYVLENEEEPEKIIVGLPFARVQAGISVAHEDTMGDTAYNTSLCGRHRTRTGIDKARISRFIRERKICQRVQKDKSQIPKGKDWNWETYSIPVPCNSFGEIQFHGYGHDMDCSPYIRVSVDTKPDVMWEIFTKHWNMDIPKLIMSVTGGAQRFDMKPRLRTRVMRGLMKASTSTDAWILTGGTNSGVRAFVGEAVRNHIITNGSRDNVVCIGVASWGGLKNRHVLEGREENGYNGLFPAVYSQQDVTKITGRDAPLDHNHTHFVLVDDGSEGRHNLQKEFKPMLEEYIASHVYMPISESKSTAAVNVPVISIIIEGGIASVTNMFESLKRKIPVLILEGSGRASDFISYAYWLTEDKSNESNSIIPNGFDEKMSHLAETMFEWKEKDLATKAEKIANCVKTLKTALMSNRLYMNVFNIKETENLELDQSVLSALLKAKKSNTYAQLSLALSWNRCDMAEREIFSADNKTNVQNMSLNDAMVTALVQDKCNFVSLFMENGLELSDFLDVKNLWNLYANCLQDDTDNAAILINNLVLSLQQPWGEFLCCRPVGDLGQQSDLLRLIGKAIVHLLGDEAQNQYPNDNMKTFDVAGCECKLEYIEDSDVTGTKTSPRRKTMQYEFEFPQKELFLWALLLNRKDMAFLFWKLTPNYLGAALFASSLLKSLSELAEKEEQLDLAVELSNNSVFFEDLAIGVLSECYAMDRVTSQLLLVRRQELYGQTTLFTLANSNELMNFMGHICCQVKLNHAWKGKMTLHTSSFKIVLCLIFPFLIPTIKFCSIETSESQQELETKEMDTKTTHVMKSKVAPSAKGNHFKKPKLRKVQCTRKCAEDGGITLVYALYYYYTAPVTVFFTNVIAYLIYLGIFSFFLMTHLHPLGHSKSISNLEYIIWGWTVTMAIEEGRQLFCRDQSSFWYKAKSWLDSIWNCFDLFLYMFFIMSVVLRLTLDDGHFIWARIIYSITLLLFYLRFMQTFFAARNIGPKVIMIRNMLTDLLFFFMILAIFMLSFGIAYQINLFPNAPERWDLLKQITYFPYFQMFGELYLENMQASQPDVCSNNETEWRYGNAQQCPENSPVVPLLAAIYLIVTNILLVNLLIAMFSHTFQKVQDNSEKVWKFHRFSLVYEYYDRPTLVPPFIIVSHFFRGCRWLIWRFCGHFSYENEFTLS